MKSEFPSVSMLATIEGDLIASILCIPNFGYPVYQPINPHCSRQPKGRMARIGCHPASDPASMAEDPPMAKFLRSHLNFLIEILAGGSDGNARHDGQVLASLTSGCCPAFAVI